MDLREIKENLKQEFKYILFSQINRTQPGLVGNVKSIQCKFSYPIYQGGRIMNCDSYYNILLCVLSNGLQLVPIISTTLDVPEKVNYDIPVISAYETKFTMQIFKHWLGLVWQTRNEKNIRSLLVTSEHLSFEAAELLKPCNTQLIILPNADLDPISEEICKTFKDEVTSNYIKWSLKFHGLMLPLKMLCRFIKKAWEKCNTAVTFNKLCLEDEGKLIVNILEQQFTSQLKRICPTKLQFEIIEVFRCLSCTKLLHPGDVHLGCTVCFTYEDPKYLKLVGIGGKKYFTCFVASEDGALVCEVCQEELHTSLAAVNHILKHLQLKWCRFCFSQLFINQKHLCQPFVLAQKKQGPQPSISTYNETMSPRACSSNFGFNVLSQQEDVYEDDASSALKDKVLFRKESISESQGFHASGQNKNDHKSLVGKYLTNSDDNESTYTFAFSNVHSPEIVDEVNMYKDISSVYLFNHMLSENSSENHLNMLQQLEAETMSYSFINKSNTSMPHLEDETMSNSFISQRNTSVQHLEAETMSNSMINQSNTSVQRLVGEMSNSFIIQSNSSIQHLEDEMVSNSLMNQSYSSMQHLKDESMSDSLLNQSNSSMHSTKEVVKVTKQTKSKDHCNAGKFVSESNLQENANQNKLNSARHQKIAKKTVQVNKTASVTDLQELREMLSRLRSCDVLNSGPEHLTGEVNEPRNYPSLNTMVLQKVKTNLRRIQESPVNSTCTSSVAENLNCTTTAKKYIICIFCRKEFDVPAEIISHVCKDIFNLKNPLMQTNIPVQPQLQKSTIYELGVSCVFCDTKLFSEVEFINHVCVGDFI